MQAAQQRRNPSIAQFTHHTGIQKFVLFCFFLIIFNTLRNCCCMQSMDDALTGGRRWKKEGSKSRCLFFVVDWSFIIRLCLDETRAPKCAMAFITILALNPATTTTTNNTHFGIVNKALSLKIPKQSRHQERQKCTCHAHHNTHI